MNPKNLIFIAMSPRRMASSNGNGYWSDINGWGSFQDATKFTAFTAMDCKINPTVEPDVQWLEFAEGSFQAPGAAAGAPTSATPDCPIWVSLDGGQSWLNAPEGVRVQYHDIEIPSEEVTGQFDVNCTHEGIIYDVWTTGDPASSQNIGTSSKPLADCVADLTQETA